MNMMNQCTIRNYKPSTIIIIIIILSSLPRSDLQKGWERAGRILAKRSKIDFVEWWPFLGRYVDLTTSEGVSLMEETLASDFGGW